MASKKTPNKTKTIKPPILFSKTQELISKITKQLDAPLLAYWNSNGGSVCQNDVIVLSDILKYINKCDKIYFFIKSSGGSGQASLRIVHLLRQSFKNVIALLPLEAASAATMLCLGADEIQMGPLAYITAVDTSLQHELSPVNKNNTMVYVSQDELSRVIKLWREQAGENDNNPYEHIYKYIHPLVLGAVDRASSLSVKLCKDILSYHMKDQKLIDSISNSLNSEYPSHSYPITIKEAKKLGLNVKDMDNKLNDSLMSLNEYYSEMGQKSCTDYDELNYHDNEILNIHEGTGIQIYYQEDKDWYYRAEERRWISMNDNSSWIKNIITKGKQKKSIFHIR
ncbi:hypothetical protein [uncultured Brachyspira sp.]|uniref:SDH family Clp fold serine proteinase n=1 Tax=uncultured Brachyspira sp. TaxID=221953 RepID=UPI002615B145|nr:hypothetical protein [uncultured Brachyspira sp.]